MLFLGTIIFTPRRCNALTIDSTYNPVLDLEISNPLLLVKLLRTLVFESGRRE